MEKKYKFNELPKEVQEELIQENAEHNSEFFGDFIDDFWYDSFIKECEENGFEVEQDNIYWSGFYSQGDGAVFTGYIYIKKFCEKQDLEIPDNVTEDDCVEICRNTSHYMHENTAYISYNEYDSDYELDDNILDKMEDIRLELCHDFYDKIYNYHDKVTSEEYIKSYLIDRDDNYDENGWTI